MVPPGFGPVGPPPGSVGPDPPQEPSARKPATRASRRRPGRIGRTSGPAGEAGEPRESPGNRSMLEQCADEGQARAPCASLPGSARSGGLRWPPMAILKLPGGTALSDFRLEKLNRRLAALRLSVSATRHWHFVEVRHEPSAGERATLDRLLSYGPDLCPPSEAHGRMVLVTPRPGTISPWSSKATDIARQCGLGGLVRRIERGTAYHVEGDGELATALPQLHDRMTEAVLPALADADSLFRHVAPKPLAVVDVLGHGRAAIEKADAAMGLALA